MGSQDGQRPNSLQFRLDGMNAEEQRLQTFRGWPVASVIDSARIAKAGFFRTGRGLEVECFACGGRISEWNFGDVAMARHRELNPNCPFVRNPTASSNIPIAIPPSPSPVRQEQKGHIRNEARPIYNQSGPDYRKEEVRVASFSQRDGKRWPKSDKVSPSALAKAGFYWNPSNLHGMDEQLSDRVTCAFCEGSLGGWESGDDPLSEHRRCSNTCPFVMGAPVGNVPIPRSPSGVEASIVEGGNSQSHPRCAPDQGNGGNRFGNEKLVELVSGANRSSVSRSEGAESLGVHPHRGPMNARYSTTEARLASFSVSGEGGAGPFRNIATAGWPASRVKQSPQSLADAGFFYTGQSDQVRCFHCDGGLWDWRDDDDPWIEHARWFPNCAYVTLIKGEDFITAAKNLRPPNYTSRNLSSSSISPSTSTSSTLPSEMQSQPSLRTSEFVVRNQPAQRVKVRNVSSEELDNLMGTPAVLMALEVGLDAGRVRNILQRKMEETGSPFSSPDALVLAVLGSQSEEGRIVESEDESDDSEEEVSQSTTRFFRNSRIPNSEDFHSSYPEYHSDSDSDDEREDNDGGGLSEEDNVEEGELENGEVIARLLRDLSRPFHESTEIDTRNVGISENESPVEQNASCSNMTSENVTSRIEKGVESETCVTAGNYISQISGAIVGGCDESKLVIEGSGITVSEGPQGKEENLTAPASASSLAALEEENRRFRESRLCKVCLDEEVGVVFLPCGHLVSCVHCAPSLKDCPVCRRPIGATVRTYLS